MIARKRSGRLPTPWARRHVALISTCAVTAVAACAMAYVGHALDGASRPSRNAASAFVTSALSPFASAAPWRLSPRPSSGPAVSRCAGAADVYTASRVVDKRQPTEPGRSSDQDGFEELCTRWNREEAENVQKSKRTLQSASTSHEAKMRSIDELEYWAIRRGGYDAEIILIGTLRSSDKQLAAKAHIALKKTWASHFNVWVNNRISYGKMLQSQGRMEEAKTVYDKVVFENPLWGEGYHLRAKYWNQLQDVNRTIDDLKQALEFSPNNYLVMVELALTMMDKRKDYESAAKLFQTANELCPLLPIGAFMAGLYEKAPHLKPPPEVEETLEAPPPRLMPDRWIVREEATERPNQMFLRVGGELEQWFSRLRERGADARTTRRLWSRLVIAWDPDKHERSLRSFTTQVHDALKARRERELAKAEEEGGTLEIQDAREDDEDAAAFLRQIRRERRREQERKARETATAR